MLNKNFNKKKLKDKKFQPINQLSKNNLKNK